MNTAAVLVAEVSRWRHSIEVAPGITTPGSRHATLLLERLGLPANLTGKTVLDVGCSDGLFSFECERRGAKSICAIDNWSGGKVTSPKGFTTAHQLLRSKVNYFEADLLALDTDALGQFDIVLCLGVVYHLHHPLLGLEQLAKLTRGTLYLESEVVSGDISTMQFVKGAYHGDAGTWWLPTIKCLVEMAEASGFRIQRVEPWRSRRVILECTNAFIA